MVRPFQNYAWHVEPREMLGFLLYPVSCTLPKAELGNDQHTWRHELHRRAGDWLVIERILRRRAFSLPRFDRERATLPALWGAIENEMDQRICPSHSNVRIHGQVL